MNDSSARYVIRPDGDGFSVRDTWTGTPAVIAMSPQIGLSEEDAVHTAELLNRRGAPEPRPVLDRNAAA